MSLHALLVDIRAAGGRLWVEEGKLKYRFAQGALALDLKARLVEQRDAVVAYLIRFQSEARSRIVKIAAEQPVPASLAQKAIWYFEQMRPDSSYYHIVNELTVRGDFDLERFREALNRAIRRHPVLRTNFESIEGDVRQLVSGRELAEIPVHDLAGREQEWPRILRETAARRFDLGQDLLIRVVAARIDARTLRMAVVTHHIVSDAISMSLLFDECREHYLRGVVAEPAFNYADYAVWEQEYWRGEGFQDSLNYWTKKLEGAPDLSLSIAKPRPRHLSLKGGKAPLALDAELTGRIVRFCEQNSVSLYSFLLSAYALLLMRYSDQDDVVVGSIVSNRERSEVRTMQGLFINSLAHRIRLDEQASVTQHVRAVHRSVIADFRHQALPFDKLLERLNFDRDASRTSFYRALLILQPDRPRNWDWNGCEIGVTPGDAELAFTDLKLDLQNTGGRLEGYLEYAVDLFERETAESLTAHLEVLLREMLAAPDERAIATPMLTAQDQEYLNRLASYREFPLPFESLHAAFERQAASNADRIALIDGNGSLSYRELNAHANQIAHALIAEGIAPGSIVGVRLPRDQRLLCCILGVLKAGAAYLVIDPQSPAQRQLYLIKDSALSALIVADGDRIDGVVTLDVNTAAIQSQPQHDPALLLPADALAYVIYTSGSTGQPKGVMIEHRHVLSLFESCEAYYGFTRDDVWTLFHSCAFDFSVWEMWGAWLYGGRLVVVPGDVAKAPDAFLRLLSEQRVTVLNQTPSAFYLLQDRFVAEPVPLAVRYVIFGGEALDTALLARWHERLGSSCQLINMYGITETTVHVTFHPIAAAEMTQNSRLIGVPRPDTGVKIRDRFGNAVPAGLPGELYVYGHGVARGYLNKPALTTERFALDAPGGERSYRTGDIVSMTPDGRLLYHGRRDSQIKIRGFRIELEEIRVGITGIAGVKHCAVALDERGERSIVAYMVLDESTTIEQVASAVRDRLPDCMVPAALIPVDDIPITTNGKVDYQKLQAHAVPQRPSVRSTGLQVEVLQLLESLLGRSVPDTGERLYALGANSLTIVKLVHAINQRFGIKLAILDVFTEPTLAGIAQRIQQAKRDDAPLTIAEPAESYPLSSEQQRLWYLHALEETTGGYNVHESLDLVGAIDPARLEQAQNLILQRHEILRTRFEDRAGVPAQVVDEFRPMALSKIDLRSDASTLEELLKQDAQQRFALAREWPIHCRLYELTDNRCVLSVTLHHIACDGWSMALLIQEFTLAYNALCRGEAPSIPALRRQYKDYACWQARRRPDLSYFLQRLADAPRLVLPRDRCDPAARLEPARRISSSLSPAQQAVLAAFAVQHGVTPFVVFQSVYTLLMSYVCRSDDIVYGLPVVNRQEALVSDLIGFFVNTLVIRTRVRREESLQDFLARIARDIAETLQHQGTPLGDLTAALAGRESPQRNLYDALFVYQNNERPAIDLTGVAVSLRPPVQISALADLTLEISEGLGSISIAWDFVTRRFTEETIRSFDAFLHQLLDGLLDASPDTSVGDFVELTSLAATVSQRNCAHRRFEHQAFVAPERIALLHAGQEMTYGDLNAAANRLARYLISQGIGAGDVVAIYCQRSFEAIVSMLAVLKSGGAYLPLEPDYPLERVSFMVRKSGARRIISHDQVNYRDLLSDVPVIDLSEFDTSPFAAHDLTSAEAPVSIDSPAYLIFTSGTTGEPKGAVITHRGLYNYLQGTQEFAKVQTGERVLQFCSLSFDASIEEIYLALLHGATLVFRNREISFGLEEFQSFVLTQGIHVVSLPVAYWHMLCQELEHSNLQPLKEQLRLCLLGGEAPNRHMVDLWHRFLQDRIELLNTYGPTECTVTTTIKDLTHPLAPEETITIGKPLQYARCYVVDETGQVARDEEIGELYIGGHALALGYVNNPEQTRKAFIDWQGQRVYRTGDRVVRQSNGEIRYISRADGQGKINGVRFEIAEIQQAIGRVANVHDCKVILRDAGVSRVLSAFVTGLQLTPERIRDELTQVLPRAVIPTDIVVLQRMPLNLNGKVDEKALLAILSAQQASENFDEECSEMFIRVSRIWAEILSRPVGGPGDNLFLSGGTSLTVGLLLNRLKKEFGVQVGLKHFMENPTVANLATSVELLLSASASAGKETLEVVEL